MKRVFMAVVIVIFSTTGNAQNIIVSPQWLNENMNDPNLVIVQPSFLKMDIHCKGKLFMIDGGRAF